MAAPVDAARATTDGSTSTTSQALNLPGGIAAGDWLVAKVRCPTATTISWPAGWTEVVNDNAADASDDVTSIAIRVADGTEGATITITLGTAARMAGICYLITGAGSYTISAVATGSASQPNSPSLTIADTRDVLWLSLAGSDFAKTLTSGPASYANATLQANTGGASGGNCTVMGASRQVSADLTEDPGAWTLDSNGINSAWTLALYDTPTQIRVSQFPVQALVIPDNQAARVSQFPVQALVIPDNQAARISQFPVQVLILPTPVTSAPFKAHIID